MPDSENMGQKGGVEHRGRPSKMKTVASIPPPGIKSAIETPPFTTQTLKNQSLH